MKITVTEVGNKQEEMISYVYDLLLIDSIREIAHFKVYGVVDKISTGINVISIENVLYLFHGITGKREKKTQWRSSCLCWVCIYVK